MTSEAKDLIQRFHRFADGLADEIREKIEDAFREDWISRDEVNWFPA
jgi:hypothetical protein